MRAGLLVRGRRRLLRWLGGATDASILRVPRFFGFLYGPIDDRLPLGEAWRATLRRRLPAHVGWRHALGGVTYLLFLILVVTGVLLSFYYRPSVEEAYPSIQYLESEVSLGWLVRGAHRWAANLVVLLALLHLLRVVVGAAYKAPRETNWLVGILLLLTLLAFGTTGALLPWDQTAYWATSRELDALARIPLLGPPVARLLRADEFVSGATLSRFFALHVIVLPWVALGLLGLHFQLLRKHGPAPPPGVPVRPGEPFYPNHMLRQLIALLVTVGVLISLVVLRPEPLRGPADPFAPPGELGTPWSPVAVLRALTHHSPVWGIPLLGGVFLFLLLLPLLDRSPERRLRRRPLAAAVTVALVAGTAGLWALGRRLPGGAGLRGATPPEARLAPPPEPERARPGGPSRPTPPPLPTRRPEGGRP